MIGRKLQIARKRAGLSLRGLAEKVNHLVTAQAISKYEHDVAVPGSEILKAIANAVGVSTSFLMREGTVTIEGVEFRANSLASERDHKLVEASVVDHLERYLEIEGLLMVPSREWDPPRSLPFPIREIADAEIAAMNMRDHFELGKNPILTLVEILEERGVKVLALDLPASFSGLTCWANRKAGGKVPVIIINAHDTGERQRFTLSHELGHMVMQITGKDLDPEKVAHRFGGALFMPEEMLWSEVGRHRHSVTIGELLSLKELFGVSVQAIAYRLKDLGIISTRVNSSLYGEFTRRGWRKPPYEEPIPLPKENPKRFERLCFRALSEGVVSESKAAELLNISVRALDARLEADPSLVD